ncbi:hypothetical protein [Stieleria magnilauensis]|uniref:MetS family NSS transporter small subunit n=1 Tax=Stieleria magnilauensis TaxID=2527963 RepID=A0ABX5XHB6_9BACT|nr:hypothetical protein TBK1r_02930 [Planctomycetes bacterium TBK1r]
MSDALFAAGDGDAFLGLLIIVGIVWGLFALFSGKPKGYDVRTNAHTKITPRR